MPKALKIKTEIKLLIKLFLYTYIVKANNF